MLFACMVMLCAFTTYAQHTITLSIKLSEGKTPLAGATVTIVSLNKTIIADSNGTAIFTNISAGSYKVKISYAGLMEREITVQIPQPNNKVKY